MPDCFISPMIVSDCWNVQSPTVFLSFMTFTFISFVLFESSWLLLFLAFVISAWGFLHLRCYKAVYAWISLVTTRIRWAGPDLNFFQNVYFIVTALRCWWVSEMRMSKILPRWILILTYFIIIAKIFITFTPAIYSYVRNNVSNPFRKTTRTSGCLQNKDQW